MAENPIPSPLPADLPTNWVYGQTVAPTGAEAGLATQYGYNYLMAAVNAAQAAINLIGTAFESLPELDGGKIPISQLPAGVAGGVASLDQTGKVPTSQLPAMNYLPLAGGNMQGAINMGNFRITNLNTPANDQDAATKAYVDALDAKVLASGYGKLSVGEYTGNGSYGSSRPTKITFPFAPKYVHVFASATPSQTFYFFWAEGMTSYFAGTHWGKISVSGNTLSWYTNSYDEASQLNISGTTYYYVGLG